MKNKDTLKKLREYGYSRAEETIEYTPGNPLKEKDYKKKALNHIIVEHVKFQECNFDEACVTGSIFRHCEFIDCTLDQADFEYCEFYSCTFTAKKPITASFNESSFIETSFNDVCFKSCTFTGSFFHICYFSRVTITISTMENSLFRQCHFIDVDFRLLNMDFMEFDQPHMINVILPMNEIPFVFGFLQYLLTTHDSVKVSKSKSGSMMPSTFLKNIIPLLCSHFNKTGQYFPLANIHYALGEQEKGYDAIKQGLRAAGASRDFRMLKHFCKLVAYTGVFSPHALDNLYHNYICRISPQDVVSADIPNYARHILEIKSILFSFSGKASIRVTMQSNIHVSEHGKLGKFTDIIFSLARRNGSFQADDIEMSLRQNSPLRITIHISGEERALLEVFSAYLCLVGISREEQRTMPVVSKYDDFLPDQTGSGHDLSALLETYQRELKDMHVHLTLMEYFAENFYEYGNDHEPIYFFNASASPCGAKLLS